MPTSTEFDIPDHLEEVFVVWGPPTFEYLVDQAGGKIRASGVAGVSSSTMSRWCQSPPGALFGQRKDMRSYRSLWFGYPNPLPGLDRIVEEILGPEESFVGRAVLEHGAKEALRLMRRPDGLGLDMLGLDPLDVLSASNDIGIPAMTRRRWTSGTPYPRQWRALDRLAASVEGVSWVECVMVHGRSKMGPRKVSGSAISVIMRNIVQKLEMQ